MTARNPDMIGKYHLRRSLGAGSQGSAYLAYDPDLGREVALKALHPHLATGEVRNRFMREARILAQIDHPNIATVFDVGRDRRSGLYYFAMEYVPYSVEQVLEVRGRLSADRAVRVAQEAASALEAARQAGITHHDVKPENLLLTSLGASGAVKLIDFGIARAGDSGGTQAGALWGTPYYMAPEQWHSVRGDTRSDVYSLGVTLYRLVSGKLPFDSDLGNPVARNTEISRMHAEDEIPGLDETDDALWEIIVRCLMKDPDERFQTPGDLAQALERYLAGEPSGAAVAGGRRAKSRGFPSSKPVWILAGLLIGTVAVAALVGAVNGNFLSSSQPPSDSNPPGPAPPGASRPRDSFAGSRRRRAIGRRSGIYAHADTYHDAIPYRYRHAYFHTRAYNHRHGRADGRRDARPSSYGCGGDHGDGHFTTCGYSDAHLHARAHRHVQSDARAHSYTYTRRHIHAHTRAYGHSDAVADIHAHCYAHALPDRRPGSSLRLLHSGHRSGRYNRQGKRKGGYSGAPHRGCHHRSHDGPYQARHPGVSFSIRSESSDNP